LIFALHITFQISCQYMGSDSHTSLYINIMFMWEMTLCSLVDRYQRFRETCWRFSWNGKASITVQIIVSQRTAISDI